MNFVKYCPVNCKGRAVSRYAPPSLVFVDLLGLRPLSKSSRNGDQACGDLAEVKIHNLLFSQILSDSRGAMWIFTDFFSKNSKSIIWFHTNNTATDCSSIYCL